MMRTLTEQVRNEPGNVFNDELAMLIEGDGSVLTWLADASGAGQG